MSQVLKAKFHGKTVVADFDENRKYPYRLYVLTGKKRQCVDEFESFQEVIEELPYLFY